MPIDPLTDPGAYDVLVAGGRTSPGLFVLGQAPRVYNWDIKAAPGAQGAFITYRGWLPTDDIGASFKFWQAGQVKDFYENFLPIFALDARRAKIKPVIVEHPTLAAQQITALVAKKIGALYSVPGGLWAVDMTFIEYRIAKRVPASSPTGTTSRVGVAGGDAIDDLTDAIQAKAAADAAAHDVAGRAK